MILSNWKNKKFWFAFVILSLVIYISNIIERINGKYIDKYFSPDHHYRIESYLLRQTGRYSSNSTVLQFKVYKTNLKDELQYTLVARYTREVFNGSWKVSWDCNRENSNCSYFFFAIGEGDTSIELPPPWYENWLVYFP